MGYSVMSTGAQTVKNGITRKRIPGKQWLHAPFVVMTSQKGKSAVRGIGYILERV